MRIILYKSPDYEIFLVDRDAHEVVKFSTEGKVLLRIGTQEIPPLHGPFNHPADIVNLGSKGKDLPMRKQLTPTTK